MLFPPSKQMTPAEVTKLLQKRLSGEDVLNASRACGNTLDRCRKACDAAISDNSYARAFSNITTVLKCDDVCADNWHACLRALGTNY